MKHRLTLDFTEKAWKTFNRLVARRETTKAETVRAALAILDLAMESDDGAVRIKIKGEVNKILVTVKV